MYLMWTCNCLSNHFSMVCFLKACHVPSGSGGASTSRLAHANCGRHLPSSSWGVMAPVPYAWPSIMSLDYGRQRHQEIQPIPAIPCHTFCFSGDLDDFLGIVSYCFPRFAMCLAFKPPKLMCSPGGSPFVTCPAKQVHPA